MAMQTVEFQYYTGLKREIFRNAILRGSWDDSGRYSESWTETPMEQVIGTDGCPAFVARVELDQAEQGRQFSWGVILSGPQGAHFWGIPTEVNDNDGASVARNRTFTLPEATAEPHVERYNFTYLRRLGANKYLPAGAEVPVLRFAVWAPMAQAVAVVFGDPAVGYIADDGTGIDPTRPVVELTQTGDGIWEGGPEGTFESWKGAPYMYRIVNAQGETVFRTDIYSRSQAGRGGTNPNGQPWEGTLAELDGTVSCSIVIDADVVRRTFESAPPGETPDLIDATDFWATEFTPGLPVPTRPEDLVIYELHIGSLGSEEGVPGTFEDAIPFLDHLVELGVTAVELLPMAEFSGNVAWGYGNTHHLAIESAAGGRDKYRHFVRECHRRGLAVIQDVVYNHYSADGARAQWQYCSTDHNDNIYYWYEGKPADYSFPEGGYVNNGSSGWAPRYLEDVVRQQFISGATFLIEEMHVDGLRVDLTQALHRDNTLNANGWTVGRANLFGQKLLREWSRTLKMIHPTSFLVAEDHTGWDAVTRPAAQGGLGFDLTWAASYYHNLIGDAANLGSDRARLIRQAGFGGNEPLQMDTFAGSLYDTGGKQVVFHESHDEAGNAEGTARTIVVAVNDAPLVGATRTAAEARVRVAAGVTLLSAGTPMYFMGEEVGAAKPYRYNDWLDNREDILGDAQGVGKYLFTFFSQVDTLRRRLRSVRSHNIDILHVSNANRVIAFKRWEAGEETIIVASLNNSPFSNGYTIAKDELAIPNATWREVFNSDAAAYGGNNVGNYGAGVQSRDGRIHVVIPANGFIVLVRS